MITKNNAELIYHVSEEYVQNLGDDIDKMTVFVQKLHRYTLVVFWGISALFTFFTTFFLIKFAKFFMFFGKNSYISVLLCGFFLCLIVSSILYYLSKRFIKRGIVRYDISRNNITKRLTEFYTIQGIYDDMMEDKMSILGVEDSYINVKCFIKGQQETVRMPVRYELNRGDKNIVRFLGDHIEITINGVSEHNFGGIHNGK